MKGANKKKAPARLNWQGLYEKKEVLFYHNSKHTTHSFSIFGNNQLVHKPCPLPGSQSGHLGGGIQCGTKPFESDAISRIPPVVALSSAFCSITCQINSSAVHTVFNRENILGSSGRNLH